MKKLDLFRYMIMGSFSLLGTLNLQSADFKVKYPGLNDLSLQKYLHYLSFLNNFLTRVGSHTELEVLVNISFCHQHSLTTSAYLYC